MSVWLLVPAILPVLALLVLLLFSRMLAQAISGLRDELRRFSVTAIASDELIREARTIVDHMEKNCAVIKKADQKST